MTNVTRLIDLRIAQIILEEYGFRAAKVMESITFGDVKQLDKEASEWVKHTIRMTLAAPNNPYKDSEEVAAAILEVLGVTK